MTSRCTMGAKVRDFGAVSGGRGPWARGGVRAAARKVRGFSCPLQGLREPTDAPRRLIHTHRGGGCHGGGGLPGAAGGAGVPVLPEDGHLQVST
jgi:hypothetical protein